jgi:hypothetical protein
MASSYQGYSGYGDPERKKVDRARQMAELLQQGATDTGPKSFWEGAAQLGKAFIARGAMDKADQAETAYGDNQKKMLALFLSQKPFGAPEASPAPQDAKLGSRVLGQASARASSRMSNAGEAAIPNVAQMAETLAMTSASPDAAMQPPAPAMTPPPAMAQAPTMAPAAGMAQPQDMSSRIANLGNLLRPRQERPQQVPQAPQMDINAMVQQHFAMTGDVQGAMTLGRELQRQQIEDQRYVDDTNYGRLVDTKTFRAGRRDADRQAGQWQQTFDQSGNQFDATMQQNADQFRTTSGLSRAQLDEQIRQFDAEQAAKKAEAEAKAEASANGLFDDPQRAKIYADSMDAVDAATKDQRRLDTIARTASQFVEDSKDWNSQGEGWWNDLGQALSMDTTSLKQLTDTIAPLVREPGSGGNSDADVAMFKSSVVSINNPKEANVRFAKGAQALAARNKEYVTYLSEAIEPNDPKSRQNANRIWLAYANENPMFDAKTGEVKTPPRFKDWLDVKMGNAPPVNSFIGKRVQAALPQAPPQDDVSDLLEKYRQ